MTAQSEQALENGLISTLQDMSFEYVQIKEETNLFSNFKAQLEKHNAKKLAEIGRTAFTDKEFEKIRIYLEGGTLFEKSKKLRDLYPLETEDGQHRIWVEFLNKNHWCQNEFQVSNQITMEGRKTCRYDVTILINGLPLVQVELKKRGVELKQAYNQVQRYQKTSFRGLFDYIQLFVISNGVNTRYFANNPNCGWKFTFNWTLPNNEPVNDLSQFASHFFAPFQVCVLTYRVPSNVFCTTWYELSTFSHSHLSAAKRYGQSSGKSHILSRSVSGAAMLKSMPAES